MTDAPPEFSIYTPRRPTLLALALCIPGVLLLCLPMFTGHLLGGHESALTWTGIPYRQFWLEELRRTGGVPQWNPYLFGGLPFVGAMHGDIFYPTAILRLLVGAGRGSNAGLFIHLVLAGFFTYLFLRSLEVSWTGSISGGISYQLSGIVATVVSPGHDARLAVSALMPLALTALVLAIRRQRPEGYGLLAVVVGLGYLSPDPHMMSYTLVLAGLFALWLVFADESHPPVRRRRLQALGLALAASSLGVGIAMLQLLPLLGYLPFAGRDAPVADPALLARLGMPLENVVAFIVPEFVGLKSPDYWGSGGFKVDSEYLGAATLLLAAVGATHGKRGRLVWFAAGAGLLFLLVSFGGHTPFYRLWRAIVPGAEAIQSPGMAFFVPAFMCSVLAGLGVERLQLGQGKGVLYGGLAAAGALIVLGAGGGLGKLAASLPGATEEATATITRSVTGGALRSALVLAAAATLGIGMLRGRLKALPCALTLTLLIGGDLFYNARRYFTWSPSVPVLYANDEVTRHIVEAALPHRTADLASAGNAVYPEAFLMAKRIPSLLGRHGGELRAYDELLGGRDVWARAFSPRIWDLLAVRFVMLGVPMRLPGYHLARHIWWLDPTRPESGPQEVFLYERDSATVYARVVAGAVKVANAGRIVPALLDPELDPDRLVLLPPDAPVSPPSLDSMPPRSPSRAAVVEWEPGAMTIRLDPTPQADAYLVVSENWYPDWRATVDGRDATVLRGDQTLITVPLPRGAREVRLRFVSDSYRVGRLVSLTCAAGALLWLAIPLVRRRKGA